MTRSIMTASLALGLVLAVSGMSAMAQDEADGASDTGVREHMLHHFAEVMTIHDALVSGDIEAVHEPAAALASAEAGEDLPESGVAFATVIQRVASTITEADSLALTAAATSTMLTACGGCHANTAPGLTPRYAPSAELDGLAGFMLEHQRGVDQLLQGLVLPSTEQWRQGAARLRAVEFDPAALPEGIALTAQARQSADRLRELAEAALPMTDPTSQGSLYTQLVMTCADCHMIAGGGPE